jgi:hypothetical protein
MLPGGARDRRSNISCHGRERPGANPMKGVRRKKIKYNDEFHRSVPRIPLLRKFWRSGQAWKTRNFWQYETGNKELKDRHPLLQHELPDRNVTSRQ